MVEIMIGERASFESASQWPEKEARRRAKGAEAVSLSEYNFNEVPEKELAACVLYEYARESREIAATVENLREQLRQQIPSEDRQVGKPVSFSLKFRKFTKTYQSSYEGLILTAFAGEAQFPTVPWQDLKSKNRLIGVPEQAIRLHKRQIAKAHPAFIAEVIQEAQGLARVTLADWEAQRMPAAYRKIPEAKLRPKLMTGFMMVDLLRPSTAILEQFRKWLFRRHPDASAPAPEPRGRNSLRDRLNALGAMRLRFYCRTLDDAQRLTAPLRRKHGRFYSDRTAWNRACKRAVEYYREILDLPAGALPIHFSKGWQK